MHEFEPTLLWAIALLPLIGFVVNGTLSLLGARRENARRLAGAPPAHDAHGHTSTAALDHGHGLDEEADVHAHDAAPDDRARLIPTLVGPGVLILAFVLGPLMEENLRRALLISRGDPTVFFTRPISAGFLIATAILLVIMILPNIRKKREQVLAEEGT